MGTFYSLHSRFTARKSVTEDAIRAWVNKTRDHDPQPSVLVDANEELCLSARKKGRTVVSLDWATHSSYGVATSLDEEWVALVKMFADFKEGPVLAESGGEEYDNGPYTWYIGPQKSVLRAQLTALRAQVQRLSKERRELETKLRKANSRLISTL